MITLSGPTRNEPIIKQQTQWRGDRKDFSKSSQLERKQIKLVRTANRHFDKAERRSKHGPGGHAHVVLFPGMVEFGKAPIDKPQLALLVIDHHIVRLHVAVHYSLRVTVVQSLTHGNAQSGDDLVESAA